MLERMGIFFHSFCEEETNCFFFLISISVFVFSLSNVDILCRLRWNLIRTVNISEDKCSANICTLPTL